MISLVSTVQAVLISLLVIKSQFNTFAAFTLIFDKDADVIIFVGSLDNRKFPFYLHWSKSCQISVEMDRTGPKRAVHDY